MRHGLVAGQTHVVWYAAEDNCIRYDKVKFSLVPTNVARGFSFRSIHSSINVKIWNQSNTSFTRNSTNLSQA
jgi:hypothetical protein